MVFGRGRGNTRFRRRARVDVSQSRCEPTSKRGALSPLHRPADRATTAAAATVVDRNFYQQQQQQQQLRPGNRCGDHVTRGGPMARRLRHPLSDRGPEGKGGGAA